MTQNTISVYDTHLSQRERIIALFRVKGYAYTQELINLGIYQYNARIKELRSDGFEIESLQINGKYGFICNNYTFVSYGEKKCLV